MACCGRNALSGGKPSPIPQAPRNLAQPGPMSRRPPPPVFEYIGGSALTAIGGATRKSYRFDRHGARLAVDPVDGPSLMAVALLRRVSG